MSDASLKFKSGEISLEELKHELEDIGSVDSIDFTGWVTVFLNPNCTLLYVITEDKIKTYKFFYGHFAFETITDRVV